MVGTGEYPLLRKGIFTNGQSHLGGRLLDGISKRRARATKHNHILEIVGEQRHIEIYVGHQAICSHRRLLGKILGTQEPFLLCGVRKEQNRSPGSLAGHEQAGCFEQGCNSCCVIERAIVYSIFFIGFCDTQMIEMR